jgi:hypothetical protein
MTCTIRDNRKTVSAGWRSGRAKQACSNAEVIDANETRRVGLAADAALEILPNRDVSGKARLHATLRRRVYDLLAISENEDYPLSKLREQAAQIYGDEPPCMHAANYIAFNGAMEFWHRPRKYLYKIKWYHRLLRHWWSFASTKFKTFDEIEHDTNAKTTAQAA